VKKICKYLIIGYLTTFAEVICYQFVVGLE